MSDNKKEFLARYGSEKHIDQILADKSFHSPETVLENPMVTPEHHEKLFNQDGPVYIKTRVAASENLPPHMRNGMMTHENSQIRMSFARRPDITDEEFQHLKHDENPDVISNMTDWRHRPMAQEPLTNRRVSDIIQNGPTSARKAVSKQRDLPPDHVHAILNSGDTGAISNVARYNVGLTSSHTKILLNHPEKTVRGHLAMNITTSDEDREKLMADPDETVRMFAKAYK